MIWALGCLWLPCLAGPVGFTPVAWGWHLLPYFPCYDWLPAAPQCWRTAGLCCSSHSATSKWLKICRKITHKKKVSFILNIAWVLLLYACLCESYLSKLVVSFLKVSDKDFSKSGCFNEKIVFKIILSFKWTLLWLEKKPTSTLYTEKFKTELNIFYKIKIWSCTYALCLGIDNSVGILRELSSSLKLLNWIFKMILQDDF